MSLQQMTDEDFYQLDFKGTRRVNFEILDCSPIDQCNIIEMYNPPKDATHFSYSTLPDQFCFYTEFREIACGF